MSFGKSGQITIAAVGKLRQQAWQTAQEDYLQRLQRYSDVRLVEVKDAVGRGFPDAVALQREGEQLLKVTGGLPRRILLAADGQQMTSERFASFLRRNLELYGQMAFLIGGPLGFAEEVVAAADHTLALSHLTFPHELARVLLLEQLYRAFTILRGESYHK